MSAGEAPQCACAPGQRLRLLSINAGDLHSAVLQSMHLPLILGDSSIRGRCICEHVRNAILCRTIKQSKPEAQVDSARCGHALRGHRLCRHTAIPSVQLSILCAVGASATHVACAIAVLNIIHIT